MQSGEPLQATTPLLDALRQCAQRPHAAFYTPGHKRGQGISPSLAAVMGDRVFQADLPELPDLDNLFAPEGVILQAQELAATAFGAEQTWFLANGSTCGIEAAILAVCNPGDKIILPRNVHQSAIAALVLSGAVPVFVQPDYDPVWDVAHSVSPAAVAAALEQHPDARAVMLVRPTYYGVCGDLEAIAQVVHRYHIPLLVDEAHGAHLAFHPDLPPSALASGADLTVQSTHKTLGAMTQAAMLHVRGDYPPEGTASHRIDRDRLRRSLQLVQSTSPSFVLLASLDAARHQMAMQGHELLSQTLALAETARTQLSQIPGISVLDATHLQGFAGATGLDRTRLTVNVTELGITGFEADEILHETLGVTAELPSLRHLTFILSLGNTAHDIEQLVQGFETLSQQFTHQSQGSLPLISVAPPSPGQVLSPRDAFFAPSETVAIAQSVGRISAELVCPYPPGIPVLVPGEPITLEAIAYLQQVLQAGGIVTGCADADLLTLKVVKA
ncbi:aminotransferase class I/II-fold pyridoxal phosphate-dependent enzyme [Oscillatoria sp. FACHB-1407]|uniref:aminotransferase class I/II-fold pyridoxal phosphate-dependent enzyme n=1 Tax=Oscillatoria sp. FACHB-1407 TaxID=2692847 RepID=UPI00168343A9|nr:aminotransferase class I/II-fold pyridoxal phosphate-dependent enzyme [Oscillatoria sp. FACHB-1407]MBD2459988.1 aminotransferase class I/II-fold pyridoxal phosphate-dependent enzyme [Oscillatoria sp. FACHB-1407]